MSSRTVVRYLAKSTFDPWYYVAEMSDGYAYGVDGRNGKLSNHGEPAKFIEQVKAGRWRYELVDETYSPRS